MPPPDLTLGRTHAWRPTTIITWHSGRPRPGVGGRPTNGPALVDDRQSSGRRELTADRASDLLRRGCALVGLDSTEARLLRLGSNAVFRLAAPVVVRISRHGVEEGRPALIRLRQVAQV
jgi:hypothetical protein